MDVFPDFGGVGAAGDLRTVTGALLMFVLIIAVLMLIVSAIIWAISSSTGNPQTATKADISLNDSSSTNEAIDMRLRLAVTPLTKHANS